MNRGTFFLIRKRGFLLSLGGQIGAGGGGGRPEFNCELFSRKSLSGTSGSFFEVCMF